MARVTSMALAFAASAFILTTAIPLSSAKAAHNRCGSTPYSYAGIETNLGTHGIAATITVESVPIVDGGHVAGWIGVGGPGKGANGTDAWIQIGINTLPDRGNVIYAEAWVPGQGQIYKELGAVPVGRNVRLAVLEVNGKPGTWRAWVNGTAVTSPVALAGSQGGSWPAEAFGESWSGGRQACNSYAYRFEHIMRAAAPGGAWKPIANAISMQDPGYKVVRQAAGDFVATVSS